MRSFLEKDRRTSVIRKNDPHNFWPVFTMAISIVLKMSLVFGLCVAGPLTAKEKIIEEEKTVESNSWSVVNAKSRRVVTR